MRTDDLFKNVCFHYYHKDTHYHFYYIQSPGIYKWACEENDKAYQEWMSKQTKRYPSKTKEVAFEETYGTRFSFKDLVPMATMFNGKSFKDRCFHYFHKDTHHHFYYKQRPHNNGWVYDGNDTLYHKLRVKQF